MTARRARNSARRGYVLVAVLWTTVAVAACALGTAVAGREAVAAAANRVALTRAAWRAEACVARALAVADAALNDPSARVGPSRAPVPGALPGNAAGWQTLDRRVLADPLAVEPNAGSRTAVGVGPGTEPTVPNGAGLGCDVRVVSSGATIDVNTADAPALRALFTALGMPGPHADSVAAAIVRRRDPAIGGRPFAAAGELEQVPGLDSARLAAAAAMLDAAWRTMVGVDSAPVDLLHAPAPVLASVPGLTAEAIAVLRGSLSGGSPDIHDMADLVARLSPPACAALLAQGPTFHLRVTFDPDVWIVTAHASSGRRAAVGAPAAPASVVTAVLEVRLAHAGQRLAVVRRRTWVE